MYVRFSLHTDGCGKTIGLAGEHLTGVEMAAKLSSTAASTLLYKLSICGLPVTRVASR
jgi:hypothetical protein